MFATKLCIIATCIMVVLGNSQTVVVDKDDVSMYQIGPRTAKNSSRVFDIDYDANTFRMDGKSFQYVSGSIHYFRVPHQYWRDRLRAMRAAGLNAISTYVEWSFHEPEYRQYDWTGDKDLVRFIEIAKEEDLYVILRPGPYICAERDMGGFPYWLLTKYPDIKLRTYDEDYKYESTIWYSKLMSKMEPLLYGNGGPIIMVQVENEYGSFRACDKPYMAWLAELTDEWVKGAAVLFTTDGPSDNMLKCGSTPGIYATVDFGPGANVTAAWNIMRKYSPRGPLVNSEFYPGWLTHWGERMASVSSASVIKTMDDMLKDKANINFYMFYGGTNFEFTAGANLGPNYQPDITSYDYDAPLTEAGDPTSKYMDIRSKIGEFLEMPTLPVPLIKPKGNYGVQRLTPVVKLLDSDGRKYMGKNITIDQDPLTMETLGQYSGLVLYETNLPDDLWDPSLLSVPGIRDRGLVYLDNKYIGILSRSRLIYDLPFIPSQGRRLQILVENQGRVNYDLAEDIKGVVGDIKINSKIVHNWTMTSFPLDNVNWVSSKNKKNVLSRMIVGIGNTFDDFLETGPVMFSAKFSISTALLDTYVDMSGWGKGFVWINGKNLGRYWPKEGPQVTLYLPGVYLKSEPDLNTIDVLEMEYVPKNMSIALVDKPNLGPTRKKFVK